MKNIIKEIKINLGKTEATITVEEARELHLALGDLLGIKEKIVVKEVVRDNWYPYVRPYYANGITYTNDNYKVTMSGTTALLTVGDLSDKS